MSNTTTPPLNQYEVIDPQSQQLQQQQQQQQQVLKRSVRDYQFGQKIGEGSYSSVYSAVDIHNGKTFAIKVLSKQYIVKEDKIKYVNIEKTTLHRLGLQHPGIVQLYYTFQDEASLFFVLDFAEYGELLSIIRKFGSLSEAVSKFYMCQIVDAVRFIHSKGVIHRDLKPENILVAHDFSLKITDFGAAKLLGSNDDPNDEAIDYNSINGGSTRDPTPSNQDRKGSFVGTAEYVSPELLKHNICGFESDVWAIGCILFQFFNGVPAFKGETEYLTFEKIINVDYNFPTNIAYPPDVIQLVKKMLVADPAGRLTIPQIMSDNWFNGVPWDDVNYIWYRKVPRFEPYVPLPSSSSNSNPSVPYSPLIKSGRNVNKSSSYQQLHSQIQQSDFNFVPSLAKKSYQPATKMKKNFLQPSPMPMPIAQPLVSNAPPPKLNNTSRMLPGNVNPNYTGNRGPLTQNASPRQYSNNTSPTAQVANNKVETNGNGNANSYTKASPSPESPGKSQYTNLRANTAFAGIANGTSSSNGSSSNSPVTTKSVTPQQQQQTAAKPATPVRNPSVAAAAAAGSNFKSSPSQPKPVATKSSAAVAKEKENTKVNKLAKPIASTTKERPSNSIKLREISGLLGPNEKILKLDTLFKSQLTNKVLNRNLSVALDDVLIDQLVTKNSYILEKNAVPVVTVITNAARVFFIDRTLNVMLVDLKANQGADYSMYDYEFETVAIDEDGQSSSEIEDVFGYLILELIKEGGDLIFLKRMSDLDRLALTDPIQVVDKNNDVVKLGRNYGWIDCLLMAKEMISKESKDSGTQSPKQQPQPSKPTTSKKVKPSTATSSTKVKKAIQPTFGGSSSASSNSRINSPKQQQISKFAYAAAAAAHK
ncbi:aspartic proteinase precursor [Scheffersomyces coipomensis]|uniref:aspartic proteinase precursor n=1 Tax=Scheffersomyces coipomensis TaxID=1788519 RepID=UPI00315D3E4D